MDDATEAERLEVMQGILRRIEAGDANAVRLNRLRTSGVIGLEDFLHGARLLLRDAEAEAGAESRSGDPRAPRADARASASPSPPGRAARPPRGDPRPPARSDASLASWRDAARPPSDVSAVSARARARRDAEIERGLANLVVSADHHPASSSSSSSSSSLERSRGWWPRMEPSPAPRAPAELARPATIARTPIAPPLVPIAPPASTRGAPDRTPNAGPNARPIPASASVSSTSANARVYVDARDVARAWCAAKHGSGPSVEAHLLHRGGWIEMDGVARALEHFRGSGVRAVALVPEKWHRSGGIFPEFPNPRVMTEDAWAILDVLVQEGSAELLPESDLSDGEALLYFALRREFVGGVVTIDQMQFRAALERAEGGPAAPAAHLAFVHHLVRYAFEGAEMRFTTRTRADSSESPPPWASDFEGMRPGCEEIRAAAPWAARAASAGKARRRDARRDAESTAEAESARARAEASDAAAAERVADEADWVDAMRAAEAAEREEAEAKVAADESAARALQARLNPIDRERARERGARGETRADGWQTATARRDKTRRDARRRTK
jgi:hypothetical protein